MNPTGVCSTRWDCTDNGREPTDHRWLCELGRALLRPMQDRFRARTDGATPVSEVYSRIALADAQQRYEKVIDRFPV